MENEGMQAELLKIQQTTNHSLSTILEMEMLRPFPMVCEICGLPRTPEYAPCGHGNQNIRKCE